VNILLDAGANPNREELFSITGTVPLYYVIDSASWRNSADEKAREEIFDLLINAGADPNAPKDSLLGMTISQRSVKWMRKLLAAGANPNDTEVWKAVVNYLDSIGKQNPKERKITIQILEELAKSGFAFQSFVTNNPKALPIFKEQNLEHLLDLQIRIEAKVAASP
jgi:hypothetical protein